MRNHPPDPGPLDEGESRARRLSEIDDCRARRGASSVRTTERSRPDSRTVSVGILRSQV
jgi:hypothetical protein